MNANAASAKRGSPADDIEARGIPRVGADLRAEIQLAGFGARLEARTRDIGVGGMCVATPSPFDLKAVSRVVVDLPTPDGAVRLQLDAEGRWQGDAGAEGAVLSGLAFRDVPAEAADLLWDVVLNAGKSLVRFLYAHADLAEFGVEEGMGLAQISRFRDLTAGRAIHRQGRSARGEDSIFLVLDGTVALTHRVRDAREAVVGRVGPGEIVGGTALLTGELPTETAVAEGAVRLLEIDRDAFAYLRAAKPWLAQRLAFAVARASARRSHALLLRLGDKL